MSLINKMLQDLDARGTPRAGDVPPEVKPVARTESALGRLPGRRLVAIAAALVVAGLGAAAWVMLPLKGKTYDVQPAAVPAPPAVAAAAPEPDPVPVAEAAPVAVEPPPETAPEKLAEKVAGKVAGKAPDEVAAKVPAPAAPAPKPQPEKAPAFVAAEAGPARETTSWAVASERARAEEARLAKRWRAEEARIAALPAGERAAAVKRLRAEQERAAAKAKAAAAWIAALKRKEAAGGPGDAPVAAASAPRGRVDTSSQNAESSYRRALVHLQEGRVAHAITGLQAMLRAHPRHEAARQTLVSLLIESGRGDEAMTQLAAALAQDARQPALAMLLARLQIERGQTGIDTLLRTLPYASGNGDYHAFLAGALQRQARYGEAIQHYQAALRAAPGNAVWWMGLGIALQADKRNAEALDAFRQARALGTLSGELQAFVERKLQQLAR